MKSEKYWRKAYTQLAAAIRTMEIKGLIREEEMMCLLDLLDLVVLKGDTLLLKALNEYLKAPDGEGTQELDEIVKATLVGGDLKSEEGVRLLAQVVSDLAKEKEKMGRG